MLYFINIIVIIDVMAFKRKSWIKVKIYHIFQGRLSYIGSQYLLTVKKEEKRCDLCCNNNNSLPFTWDLTVFFLQKFRERTTSINAISADLKVWMTSLHQLSALTLQPVLLTFIYLMFVILSNYHLSYHYLLKATP